jgi:hypothetical protein
MSEKFNSFESSDRRLSEDPFYDPQDPAASERYELYTTQKDYDMAILCDMFPDLIREVPNDTQKVGIKLIMQNIDEPGTKRWVTESVGGEFSENYRLFVEFSYGQLLDHRGSHNMKNSHVGLECKAYGEIYKYSKLNMQIEPSNEWTRFRTLDRKNLLAVTNETLFYSPNNGVVETFLRAHSEFNQPQVSTDFSKLSTVTINFFQN